MIKFEGLAFVPYSQDMPSSYILEKLSAEKKFDVNDFRLK